MSKGLGIFTLVGLALIGALAYKGFKVETECAEYGKSTGQQVEYKQRVGCLVKQGDFWVIKR